MALSKTVSGFVAAVALTGAAVFASVPAQTNTCAYQFNTNLRYGAVATDVQALQKVLNMDAATRVAVTGAGSTGYETLRFGPATLSAVKRFQAANGVSPVSGYVGPLTRAALNTICVGNGNTTPTTPGNGNGIISNNIPVSVLVQKQAVAKLGEFVVTGNGMVTNVTLQRIGLSNNSALQNVYLYDGATRITDASSVRTDGSIAFNAGSGLFAVNGSKTITVRADIADATAGQTVGVALTGITMMGGTATPVTGVNGPLFSISSATVAGGSFNSAPTPSASSYTSSTPLEITAGSMGQTLWNDSVSITQNPVKMYGATFKMIGSAPANALSNVQLYVDGVSRGSAGINSMNQFVFSFGTPIYLTTGSHTVELRGDVVSGADRTFYVTLERGSDIMIEDSTLPGVFVSVKYASNDLFNLNAGTIKVKTGTMTITQDTSFNNVSTLVAGASNQRLASWKVTAYGEDVKVNTLSFAPTVVATTTTLANVGLYLNGAQVGSSQTATNGTTLTFNGLGSNLYLPAGQTLTLELRGDIMTSSSGIISSGAIQFNMNVGSSNAQGVSSYTVSNTPSATGQSLTIGGSSATVAIAAGSAISTKAANQTGVKIGSFTIQTGSSEGITLNQVVVSLTNIMSNQLTNLTVKDGSTVLGTPIGAPTASSNNFSTNLSIPANTTKTLDVYADFGSAATGSVTPSMGIVYLGSASNISNTVAAVPGLATTIGTPTVTAAGVTFVQSNSPVAQFVVGNQTNFNIGTFNIKTSGAGANIAGATVNDIHFTVPANTIGTVTVNGKTGSIVSGGATVQGVNISVPSDNGGVNVPVSVSLVCVGAANSCAGVSNSSVTLALDALTYNNGTASTTVPSITATTPAHKLVASKPVITFAQTSTSGLTNGNVKLGEVTIAADADGDVEVGQLPISITGAGATAPEFQNVMVKDSSGSVVIVGTLGTNGTTVLNTTAATSVAGNFVFSTPRKIAKGTSETYTIYGTVSQVTGAANTVSVTSALGAAGSFLWNDVVGGGSNIQGTAIYSYPTNTQTKTN